MMLSIRTYKVRKSGRSPIYKTYRFACFDSIIAMEGKSFEEKFNTAMNVLKEQIKVDRDNNEMDKYENIVIADVFLS